MNRSGHPSLGSFLQTATTKHTTRLQFLLHYQKILTDEQYTNADLISFFFILSVVTLFQ